MPRFQIDSLFANEEAVRLHKRLRMLKLILLIVTIVGQITTQEKTLAGTGDTPLNTARTSLDSQSAMTELILPNDTNTLGNLLGGRLMHFIDLVAAMAAYRHARNHVVTASMDHIDFIAPVHVGDLLVLNSSVNRSYRTSMEVGVKVWAENAILGTRRHVASAYLTFVAIDAQGAPTAVPQLLTEDTESERRFTDAGRRREQRQAELTRRRAAGKLSPVAN